MGPASAIAAVLPSDSVPQNPRAWLVSTGRFKAIDKIRRRAAKAPLSIRLPVVRLEGTTPTKERLMARYVDGFVLPIAKKNLATYRRVARLAGKIWREHGALEYVECVADSLESKMDGKVFKSIFPKMAGVKPGETVVFSWITYKSKSDRNRIMKLVMTDPRMANMDPSQMGFDMKRMAWGGFKPIVEA